MAEEGPTGHWEPLDSDTETGDSSSPMKLDDGEVSAESRAQSWPSPQGGPNEVQNPHSTELKGVRRREWRLSGAAGDTPACSVDADPVEVHAEHQWVKGKL